MSVLTSPRGQKLLAYLPVIYRDSVVLQSVLQGAGSELDELRRALDETLAQFYARTATWGLERWEKALGLVPPSDASADERRDAIVGRLRGYGTPSRELIESIISAYARTKVAVAKECDQYTVTARFKLQEQARRSAAQIEAIVRAILPAHLAFVLAWRFLTGDLLDSYGVTWEGVETTWVKLGDGAYRRGLTWDDWDVWSGPLVRALTADDTSTTTLTGSEK